MILQYSNRCRIGALLVKEKYFEKSELKSVVSSLLTPLKETKSDVTVAEALLTLILNIIQGKTIGKYYYERLKGYEGLSAFYVKSNKYPPVESNNITLPLFQRWMLEI